MNIASFIIYCFIVTFTPGPTNIVILSTVHNYGSKKAIEYTYGATIAFGLLLGLSALLNTMLITVLPKILIGMQIIGTIYMLYLAYQIYRMDTSKPADSHAGTFISGFLMQFLNPKVVLFTMTVIPSFILPYYTDMRAVTISVFVITVIGFLAFLAWILFGTIFKGFLQKHDRIVNVGMALCLVYATLMIWK
ncbi:Threonine/homoserine/homoserine lactone efflux protein [Fictibacillus solisalsi]|uniref:Threonine/homoserine/homoserine lactone efflux protein n=1 Tax=Fictibacillus solisalsi TaxID=459525 RepID=A0A1G9TU60_9BACL|nr:LysE family transporter [Fictibacillus solisalsi]SDM50775.1 Threonine/homoserine/homoserine lactone efflux protein [Fictibacillus solisalsi]